MGSAAHTLGTVEGMLLSGFMETVTSRSGRVAGWLGSGANGVLELRVPAESRQEVAKLCLETGVGLTPLGRYRAVLDFPDGSFSIPVLTATLETTRVAAGLARVLLEWDEALRNAESPEGLPPGMLTAEDWQAGARLMTERDLINCSRALAASAWGRINDGVFGTDFQANSAREDVLATLLADGHGPWVALHDASHDLLVLSRSALERCHLLETAQLLARR